MPSTVAGWIVRTPLEKPVRWLLRRPAAPPSRVEQRNADYDRMTVEIARRVLGPTSNSVDAGANKGVILKELLRAAPDGRHFAFEPIPRLAKQLRGLAGAEVHECALSDETGEATFQYMPGLPTESSLFERPHHTSGHEVVELRVAVRRLDDVLPPGVPIHFMKIDVEDAEIPLLRGAMQTLRQHHPVVVVEAHVRDLAQVMELFDQAGLHTWLVTDYLAGEQREASETLRIAHEQGEWYFVGSPV